jgi:hypothetical protein
VIHVIVLLSYRVIRILLVQKFSCPVAMHGHETSTSINFMTAHRPFVDVALSNFLEIKPSRWMSWCAADCILLLFEAPCV